MDAPFPTHITTARLTLAPLSRDDKDAVFREWASDPQVTRFLSWRTARVPEDLDFFLLGVEEGWLKRDTLTWIIRETATREVVGSISARLKTPQVEFGYVLRQRSWGQGYMTEVLSDLAALSLQASQIFRVCAFCDSENLASARVMEKSGFSREGLLRRYAIHPQTGTIPRDCWMYARPLKPPRMIELVAPDSTRIRPATPEDAPAIARIHIETWRSAYRGIIPDAYLAELSIERRTQGWEKHLSEGKSSVLIWETQGNVLGWVSFGLCRDEDSSGYSEIYAIYVDSTRQRAGVGAELMRAAEAQLWKTSAARVTLWVLERNEAGRRFYEKQGYECGALSKNLDIGGTSLVELRYEKARPAT